MQRALLLGAVVARGADVVTREEFNVLLARFGALDHEHREQRIRIGDLEEENRKMQSQLAATAREPAPPVVSEGDAAVDAAGGVAGRRLQSSSASYVAVEPWIMHALGPSCTTSTGASDSGMKRLVPRGASPGHPSPTTATDTLDLVAVATDWTTATIQSMPAPFVIEHDDSCAFEPSLRIGLNTSFAGSLSVNGHPVAAGPRVTDDTYATGDLTLSASGWTDLSGMTKSINLDGEATDPTAAASLAPLAAAARWRLPASACRSAAAGSSACKPAAAAVSADMAPANTAVD